MVCFEADFSSYFEAGFVSVLKRGLCVMNETGEDLELAVVDDDGCSGSEGDDDDDDEDDDDDDNEDEADSDDAHDGEDNEDDPDLARAIQASLQ